MGKPQDDAGHTAITQGRDVRCPTGATALPGPHKVGTPLTAVSGEGICVETQGKAVEAEPLMGDAFALFDFPYLSFPASERRNVQCPACGTQ